VVRITFDINDPAVSSLAGVNDGPASHGAVAAYRRGLFGILRFEHLGACFDRFQIKAQSAHGHAGGCRAGNLDELPSIDFHRLRLLSLCGGFVRTSGCAISRMREIALDGMELEWKVL
jgi:hypothetical protein